MPCLSAPGGQGFRKMSDTIRIHGKDFKVLIPSEKIQEAISSMAERVNADLKGKKPLFIAILNGSFLFASDLLRRISVECEITFLKVASYNGTSSTGKVFELIGLNEEIKGRTVVVLEDIVDTGVTLEKIVGDLKARKALEIKIATLLFKPAAYTKKIKVDYVGLEVENKFLVGYGLDYDGEGRNLNDIYALAE